MTRDKILGALLACAVGAGMTVSPATADPTNTKNGFGPISVVCDNGDTFDVFVNGRGEFTAAHITNSTSTLVPVEFGPSTFTVTDEDGNILFTESDPGSTKGQSASGKKNLVDCTYTIKLSDPSTGETVTGSGSVVGFVTPNRDN